MRTRPPRKKRANALTDQDADALLAFLLRGELGHIKIGMSYEEVVRALGQPSSTQVIEPPMEILWYSQWLELTFNDGKLEYLSLRYKWQKRYRRRLWLPGIFRATWARKVATWNPNRFRMFLHSHGLGYDLFKAEDGSLSMRSLNGSLVFDDVRRMGLHSINHTTGAFSHRFPRAVWKDPSKKLILK